MSGYTLKSMQRESGNWINQNTKGLNTVVEFGAGFFGTLKFVHECVSKKIGIEIFKPYIDNAKYHDCVQIHGDFLKFEDYINDEDMDCALFYDAIEHVKKNDGIDLMKKVQRRFNKILLMVPEGIFKQESDIYKMGADKYQAHRSSWYKEDVKSLGFQDIIVDPKYHARMRANTGQHNTDTGCIFAVWNK